MRHYGDSLEIVDMSDRFQGSDIKIRPGLTSWKVMIESKEDYAKIIEIPSKDDKLYLQHNQLIEESCFPDSEETNKNVYKLQNCIRLFPHDSDTSGFFITMFRKIKPTNLNEKGPKSKHIVKDREIFMIKDNPEVITWLKDYYGIDRFPIDQLVTQSTIAKKLSFISKGVLDVLNADKRNQLKLICLGVKLFSFNKLKGGQSKDDFCKYRICQDGLSYLIPFLTKRIYFCNEALFIKLLKQTDIMHVDIEDEELRLALGKIRSGCVIIVNVKEKPIHTDVTKYEYNDYLAYLRKNYLDAICGYTSAVRLSTMINKDHHYVFGVKYNLN
jgi:multisite-specific tRNA:(cytosine-C5)-methyltransferase